MAPSPLMQFSTSAVPASRRLAVWNDFASGAFGPLIVESRDPDRFVAGMKRLRLADCEMMSAWSSAAVIRCERPCVHHGAEMLHLEIQRRGSSVALHGGRRADLAPGDCVLLDPSRPGTVWFRDPVEVIVVRLPRPRLLARIGDPTPFLGARVEGARGAGAMLSGFLLDTWTRLQEHFDAGWSNTLSDVIFSLIELVYGAHRPDPRAPTLESRRGEACALLEARLCDAELAPRDVARSLGVSLRYLQMLFATLGTTPSAYLLNRRLELAAACLRRGHPQAISQVAYSVGFADLSYFCRTFRRRFGVTPRAYRRSDRPVADSTAATSLWDGSGSPQS